MGIVELLLTAIGLSMDAFAAAICKGLNMQKLNHKQAAIIALFFGYTIYLIERKMHKMRMKREKKPQKLCYIT